MSTSAKKVLGVGGAVVILGVLIGLYVATWATSQPTPIVTSAAPPSSGGSQLTLETVAAIGPKYEPSHPDWVSYLVRKNNQWIHSTVYKVPANSIVHVTIYQYDGDSGLRNPFLSQVQGTVGGTETVDGKTINAIPPEEASHTFVIPQLGVFVPLPGVPEEAKNQCEFAPCEGATHRTISFSFKTGKKGRFRWQCFVPCAAGYINGFGGPMQTLGYMDGFIQVV
ncbi:MAG TPA: hypothetical protein VGN25_10180 [Solirubrobacteraceae bacterium]|nr:hypothetical protein [Solirubrobacteraceae bacterium]